MENPPTSFRAGGALSRPHAWILGALLLALALRCGGSWGKELWLDELHSAAICQRPVAEWVGPGALGGYTPLYFLAALPFSRAGSDLAARTVSILAGTLLLLAVPALLAVRAGGDDRGPDQATAIRAALILAALAPPLLVFSSYHRMYALYALLQAGAWILWDRPGRAAAAGCVLASALAFLTFPVASFYAAALLAFALLVRHHRTRAVIAVAVVAALGLLWSAEGLGTIEQEAGTQPDTAGRFPAPSPALYVAYLKFLAAGPIGVHHPYLRQLALVLLGIALVALLTGARAALRGERRRAFLLHAVLLPPLCEVALLPLGVRMFQFKSYLPGALPLILLLALALADGARSGRPRIAAAAFAALGAALTVLAAAWIDPARPFSMNEPRSEVFRPLVEAAGRLQEDVEDETAPRPLILRDPTSYLAIARYGGVSPRRIVAAPELFPIISVPGRYRELMVRVGTARGIEIAAAPIGDGVRRLEIARTPPDHGRLVARSPAGIGLYAVN